jgi:hypothetical protein
MISVPRVQEENQNVCSDDILTEFALEVKELEIKKFAQPRCRGFAFESISRASIPWAFSFFIRNSTSSKIAGSLEAWCVLAAIGSTFAVGRFAS